MQNLYHQLQSRGKVLDPCTSIYLCAFPPVIEPYLLPQSADELFMEYSNSTKFIIYFDPKTRCTKKTFHYYIGEYDIKLHSEESMSLGVLMLQEYPSGVYQPGTTSPDPKMCLIQLALEIIDSPFALSEIMNL